MMYEGALLCVPRCIELEHAGAEPNVVLGITGLAGIVRLPIAVAKANALIDTLLQPEDSQNSIFAMVNSLLQHYAVRQPWVGIDVRDSGSDPAAVLAYHEGTAEEAVSRRLEITPADGILLAVQNEWPLRLSQRACQTLAVPGQDSISPGAGDSARIIPFPGRPEYRGHAVGLR